MPFKLTSTDGIHSLRAAPRRAARRRTCPEQRHPDHRPDHLAAPRGGGEHRRRGHRPRSRVEQRHVRQWHPRRELGGQRGRRRHVRQGRVPAPALDRARRHRRRPSRAVDDRRAPAAVGSARLPVARRPASSASADFDKSRQKLATLLEVSKGLGRADRHRHAARQDRRLRVSDSRRRSRRDSARRRRRRAASRRSRATNAAATARARCRSRSLARRSTTRSRSCPTTPARTRASADSRFSCSRFGRRSACRSSAARIGRSAFCTSTTSPRRTASATTISSSASRSPASPPSRSRTASTRSAFSESCSRAATSSASSRRNSRSASPSRPRRSGSAATSVQSRCCSATFAASRRCRKRCARTTWRACSPNTSREMVDCVFRHDGTLDKFIGDSVMAQWGAPIGSPDDADKAMAAAIEMMHELDLLNAQLARRGTPAAADRHRPQLRRGVRGQHRIRAPARVHRHRRHRQHRESSVRRRRSARDPALRSISADAAPCRRPRRVPADGAQEQEPTCDGLSRRARLMGDAGAQLPAVSLASPSTARSRLRRSVADALRDIVARARSTTTPRAIRSACARGARHRLRRSASGDVERVVVRHNRHGGLLAPLTRDLFRAPTRAPRELRMSDGCANTAFPRRRCSATRSTPCGSAFGELTW